MLSSLQALILGALQGVSELFPISSLGHSVILPALLGWNIDEQSSGFLVFLVATHFATALVLFFFFFKDWMRILGGILRSFSTRRLKGDTYAKLGWLLIVSTVPAGILGLLFQKQIQTYFLAPVSAAFFLILNGALLYGAERLRRRAVLHEGLAADGRIAALSWKQGIIVGTMQCLALIPGFSRTGASLAGGLMVGLSHEDAVRFSFLLATPIIAAAAVLKLPGLVHAGGAEISLSLIGATAAAVCAFFSVTFLTRYFRFDRGTLTPFAIYCALAGIVSLILISFVG